MCGAVVSNLKNLNYSSSSSSSSSSFVVVQSNDADCNRLEGQEVGGAGAGGGEQFGTVSSFVCLFVCFDRNEFTGQLERKKKNNRGRGDRFLSMGCCCCCCCCCFAIEKTRKGTKRSVQTHTHTHIFTHPAKTYKPLERAYFKREEKKKW